MEFLNKFSVRQHVLFLLFFLIFFLIGYKYIFGFHPNNDTDGFIYSIQLFRGQDAELYAQRYLNPLYPVLAGNVLFFLSPVNALIFLNLIFFVGIALLTYDLIRRVFKNNLVGLISACIIITSYPMIRYALTQVQDMGGYFWFVATLYAGWRWFTEDNNEWLALGSISTAFGLLTKESGAMAAVFFGLLILYKKIKFSAKVKNIALFSIAPFVTLLINKIRGADVRYDSAAWFIDNWRIYYESQYTLFKWAAINASTFNLLWLFFIIGIYYLYKERNTIDKNIFIYLLAVLPSSLSYFAWPLFISRTVFISAWFIVPVASFALYKISIGDKIRQVTAVLAFVLVIFAPAALQLTLRYAHVFKIYDDCDKKIVCSWNYFWQNRHSFSKEL